MRILTVGNMYPPHHRGGYELVWESAVAYLRDRGHDVRVLTTTHREPEVSVPGGSEPDVFRELSWYWSEDSWPRLSPAERFRIEKRNLEILARHLGEQRPDVVCWWAMGGMSTSMIQMAADLQIAEAFVVCDDWLLYALDVDGWHRAMRRLGPLRDYVRSVTKIGFLASRDRRGPALFPSDTVHRRASEAGWRFSDVSVCHQGVPHAMFPPARVREWGWELLYVGRLDPRKGVELAVEALRLLPEASLRIVGGGDERYRAELIRLAEQHGLTSRIAFETSDRDALGGIYAASDVVLFPVLWREPWGLVPLEAMSVGTPVIASGRGGSGEYLRDGVNSLLVDVDAGPEPIASCVRRLASDPELRSRLREAGIATSAAYGPDDFNEAVEALLMQADRPPS